MSASPPLSPKPSAPASPLLSPEREGEQESSERLRNSPLPPGPRVGLGPPRLPGWSPGGGLTPRAPPGVKGGVNTRSLRATRVRPWGGGDSLGWGTEVAFWEPCPPPPEDANSAGASFQKNPPLEIVPPRPPKLLQPLLGGQHHLGACGERVPSGRGGESEMEVGGETVG